MLETLLDAVLHRTPELHQTTADFLFRTPDPLVRHHQLGNPQVVRAAQRQQLRRTGEIVRQHRAVQVHHAA
ncbi:hypothetical protein D3C80_2146720 [compost metagenome]